MGKVGQEVQKVSELPIVFLSTENDPKASLIFLVFLTSYKLSDFQFPNSKRI